MSDNTRWDDLPLRVGDPDPDPSGMYAPCTAAKDGFFCTVPAEDLHVRHVAVGSRVVAMWADAPIWVVSWVYWNGDEQGGGGFFWFHTRADAERHFASEKQAWAGPDAARVRLVRVDLPDEALTCDCDAHGDDLVSPITCWLDSEIDALETEWPAEKVWINPPGPVQHPVQHQTNG